MSFPLNDLGQALTTQIYQTILGGDSKVPPPKNTFFTWTMPGLPLTEQDLDFCAKGLFSATEPEDARARLTHAFNLAMLLDYVPDADAPYTNERQEGMFKPDAEKHLSEMYRQILKAAKLAHHELTEEQQAKLEKLRGKLFVTKKVTDLVTDEVKEVTEESPLLRAYNEKMANYFDAVLEYNAKRTAAMQPGPQAVAAVADWSMNAQTYYLKVKSALDAWISGGYRNEVDQINAYINQVTGRSLVAWVKSLQETFEKGLITGTDVPIPFPYTTFVPGDVAKAGGWTRIGVSHEHVQWAKDNAVSKTSGSAGLSFGLFSVGGSGGVGKETVSETQQVSSFEMSFDICQAVVVRPWFYPEFFANRGWTLAPGDGWHFDEMPATGERPPKGEFIGYATQAVFVRDVEIKSAEFVSAYESVKKKVEGGGKVGWGPFNLSGSHSKDTAHEEREETRDGETLRVEGMQIIGFVNHLLDKTPNPDPELKPEDFV